VSRPDRRTVKVWFHRTRAAFWLVLACLVFPLGWEESIALVILASLYANFTGDWGAAEAADDRELVGRLKRIETLLTEIAESTRRS
jgi:hypothetical protein